MTIQEAQDLVDKWITTTGVRYFNELTNTAILMEEVGEVARIMSRKYGEQSFKKSDEQVDLGEEMADVIRHGNVGTPFMRALAVRALALLGDSDGAIHERHLRPPRTAESRRRSPG